MILKFIEPIRTNLNHCGFLAEELVVVFIIDNKKC